MKKTIKLTVLVCLVVCLVAALCLATACNPEAETATYSVTVKNSDGTGVSGVDVNWDNFGPVVTDEQGKATIDLEIGEYNIVLANLPQNTSYEAVKATKDNKDIEITLKSTLTEGS